MPEQPILRPRLQVPECIAPRNPDPAVVALGNRACHSSPPTPKEPELGSALEPGEGQTATRERQRLWWGDGGEDRRKPDRAKRSERPSQPPDGDAQGISEPVGGDRLNQ